MTSIVSLPNVVPAVRFDSVPWTQAQIGEAPVNTGPFTLIDTLALTPLDADPSAPRARNLTTPLATLTTGWYQVTFLDAAGHRNQLLAPYPYPPTAAALVLPPIAQLADLKQDLGITDSSKDSYLMRLLASVSTRIEVYTGRSFRPNPPLDATGHDTLPPVTLSVYPLRTAGSWFPDVFNVIVPIPTAREIDVLTLQGQPITQFDLIGDPPYTTIQVYDLLYRYFQPNYLQLSTLGPKLGITGRFGYNPPPDDIIDAVIVMAARRYKEREARYGDSVVLPDGGMVNYFRQLPPSVAATLNQYRTLGI